MSVAIKEIFFRSGPDGTTPKPVGIRVGKVVVLVGPNGSGKSTTLRELEQIAHDEGPGRVVSGVAYHLPSDIAEVQRALGPFVVDSGGDGMNVEVRLPGGREFVGSVSKSMVERALQSKASGIKYVLGPLTARLDGHARLQLAGAAPSGSMTAIPKNHLAALFRDDVAKARLRDISFRCLRRR